MQYVIYLKEKVGDLEYIDKEDYYGKKEIIK